MDITFDLWVMGIEKSGLNYQEFMGINGGIK